MLKQSSPGPFRRCAGAAAGLVLCVAVAGVVYAASPQTAVAAAGEYQLDMKIAVSSEQGGQRHARDATLALCVKPGEPGRVDVHDWAVDASVAPEAGGVRVRLALKDAGGAELAQSELQGALGRTLHSDGDAKGGSYRYAFEVTPRAGCPARRAAQAAKAS